MASAEERLDARDQLPPAEGLRDVVVRAQVETQDDVLLLALGGQHQDRHLQAVLADGPADLITVHPGQHDVEQDQAGVARQRQVEAVLAMLGGQDFVALGLRRCP